MSKNRINVNGIWYVEEDSLQQRMIEYRGIVAETDTSCFEFTVNIGEDRKMYGASIKYTDKRGKNWSTDYWDNEKFIASIPNRDDIEEVNNLTTEDQIVLIDLINKAKELKFI